jgi:hypothetical protein
VVSALATSSFIAIFRLCLLISYLHSAQNQSTLRSLVPTTPWKANRAIWLAVLWSLGGDVASTRSDGDCAKHTAVRRTAQAPPSIRKGRYPLHAAWAGRQRQSYTAAPLGAVADERRTMASNNDLVAVGGRSSIELDKKPI